jgi:hypothetical protein
MDESTAALGRFAAMNRSICQEEASLLGNVNGIMQSSLPRSLEPTASSASSSNLHALRNRYEQDRDRSGVMKMQLKIVNAPSCGQGHQQYPFAGQVVNEELVDCFEK